MSTLSTIRDNVFVGLAEASGGTWQESEIDQFINREYEHLQTKINEINDEFFGKRQTTSTTTNEFYSFPSDFVRLLMIEIKFSNTWQEVHKISMHQASVFEGITVWDWKDPHVYYYILNDQYALVPQRTAAGSNDLRVYYIYKPDELSADDDIPSIPLLYHELLELGAINRARRSVKEPPIDQQDYNVKLESMLETCSPRVKHHPRQVRMIPGLY